MAISIEYNNGKHLSIDMVRRLDRMSDEDRKKMGENLKLDASEFQTRILLSGGREKKARESVEEIAQQVAVVDVDLDRWVIADNIIEAVPFTKEQAEKAKANGSQFNHDFCTAVDTVAGRVLSTETPAEICRRRTFARKQGGPK